VHFCCFRPQGTFQASEELCFCYLRPPILVLWASFQCKYSSLERRWRSRCLCAFLLVSGDLGTSCRVISFLFQGPLGLQLSESGPANFVCQFLVSWDTVAPAAWYYVFLIVFLSHDRKERSEVWIFRLRSNLPKPVT
jgi:hypothetical protein